MIKFMDLQDVIKSKKKMKIIIEMNEIHKNIGMKSAWNINNEQDEGLEEVRYFNKFDLEVIRIWEYTFAVIEGKLKKEMVVADIGCGNSPLLAWCSKYMKCSGVGIETTDNGQNENNENRSAGRMFHPKYEKEYGLKNNAFEGGILNEEVPKIYAKTFDRIFSSGVFEHIGEYEKAFKNVREILKDDGIICITMDKRDEVKWIDKIYEPNFFKDMGLELVGEIDKTIKCNYMKWGTVFGIVLRKVK